MKCWKPRVPIPVRTRLDAYILIPDTEKATGIGALSLLALVLALGHLAILLLLLLLLQPQELF